MIDRYSLPEMAAIWSAENRYKLWLEVEIAALEGMVEEGSVPEDAVKEIKEKATFSVDRIFEIEAEVKHDVIAFLTNVAESVGPASRFVHRGMTSNDLLDTTFGLQLKAAGALLLSSVDEVLQAVKKRAIEFKDVPCIGRSHGIHAEPTTFGVKVLSWYAELQRQRVRLERAIQSVSVGKLAGAVGTYASLNPTLEKRVLSRLGLECEAVPSQIVHRDRHAEFFSALAQVGTSLERFCVEIRHLQRTEVREAEERFTKGQKGSSAMPHKRNPILTENLTGLARLLRGYAQSAFENVPLWHERDISHSSVERVIAPDACILLHFMLNRFRNIVSGLVVYPERMKENLQYTRGLWASGTVLIKMVDGGLTREEGYALTQKHALESWEGGASFQERLQVDEQVLKYVSSEDLERCFSLEHHLAHVGEIFRRVLGEGE